MCKAQNRKTQFECEHLMAVMFDVLMLVIHSEHKFAFLNRARYLDLDM